ncbi:prephenate dehydrogenase [Streptomyces sp. NPDC019937]|uniref:prephenate dehydrogenase n=1 Tax=Streptomyces sp. NPDC019937 TaxID=3154787 RepID=UPI0033F2F21E
MANALSADKSVGSTIEALKAELPQLEKQQEALKGDLDAVTQRLEVVSTALSSLQALSGAAALPQTANGDIAEAKPKPVSEDTATAADAATEAEPKAAAEAAATRTPTATRKAAIGRQRSKAKSTTGGRTAKTATKAAAKKTAAKKPAKKAAAKDTTKSTTKATTKAAKATDKSAPASEKATAKATEKTAKAAGTSSERSTGLAESVLGCLRKAGRPMRASEVNEALGRDETRTNVNSVRNTLERLRTTERAKRSGRGLYEAAATS